MSLNLEDFSLAFKKLEQLTNTSNVQMRALRELFDNVKKVYAVFSDSIKVLGERFHKFHQDSQANEQIFPFYQYVGNQLLKISDTHKEFSKDIESIISNPYSEFLKNIETSTSNDLTSASKVLEEFKNQMVKHKKSQDEYYRLSKATEKQHDVFTKLRDEGYAEDEKLRKAQDKLGKNKQEEQEGAKLYQNQIEVTNQYWHKVYDVFPKLYKQYDDNNSNINHFTQNALCNMIKFINEFYLKNKVEMSQNIDEKIKDLSKKKQAIEENIETTTDTLHTQAWNLVDALEKQPLEIFLSYEAKKKNEELEIAKFVEQEEYTIIYGASNELDLQFLLNYTKNFLPKKIKSVSNTPTLTSADLDLSASLTKSTSSKEKLETQIQIPLSEEDEKRFKEILENPANRKFLFETLNKQKDTSQSSGQIRLAAKEFNILKECLSNLISLLFKEKDYETLTFGLPLTVKYCTMNDDDKLEFLFHSLKELEGWQNKTLWLELTKVLFNKKMATENLRQKKTTEYEKKQAGKTFWNKLSAAFDGPKKATIPEREIYLTILQDMCLYLSRLTKNHTIASEIITALEKEFDFVEDGNPLATYYRKNCDTLINDEIINVHSQKKQKKNQSKWGKFIHIYLSLDFLQPSDLVHLLELNKETRKLFKKKVYRTIFYNFGESLTQTQRFTIWKNILEINDLQLNFEEIYEKVVKPARSNPSERDDVIKVDVLRSFTNHKNFSPEILEGLLRSLASLDRDISYCQGMNYVMGYLLISLQNPNESFKCFVRLMDWHMKPLFQKEFIMLKLNFFKFNRIMEIYMPDLCAHFKTEKIETNYFLPSWFITVFSNNFQYTKRSKFLEKIWDFFILDGFKVIFKTALLVLMEYQPKLLKMKFDSILKFLRDIGKEELFTNQKYFEAVEQGSIVGTREFGFIKDFGTHFKNLNLPHDVLNMFDEEFEISEAQLKARKSPTKEKRKEDGF